VKISTVRWHLASMYRKTATNRQAELVRLLCDDSSGRRASVPQRS
jgi:hypothetical protein